jgi:fibrillarin-like pre-rRNA processing protein
MERLFQGVFREGKRLYTKNLVPGSRVYGEWLEERDGVEYRSWNPYRSKMAVALLRGLRTFPVHDSSRMLYLGVASGTTASHFSDIATDGVVYGVDPAFRPMKDFVALARLRYNLVPVHADANKPEQYRAIATGVDVVYQDIAQKNQVPLFLKNMQHFDAPWGIIMVKSRSIDVARPPKTVFQHVQQELSAAVRVVETRRLDPQAKDHACIVVQA